MNQATLLALAIFPDQLEQFYAAVPARRVNWTPPSWDGIPSESLTAIGQVCHVRDIEIDGYQQRIERALTESNPHLPSLDTYQLAKDRNYANANAAEALATFRGARRRAARTPRRLRGLRLGHGPRPHPLPLQPRPATSRGAAVAARQDGIAVD